MTSLLPHHTTQSSTLPRPSPDQSGCQIGDRMHHQSRLQRRFHLGRTEEGRRPALPHCTRCVFNATKRQPATASTIPHYNIAHCSASMCVCHVPAVQPAAQRADRSTHSDSIDVLVVSSEGLLALAHADIPQLEGGSTAHHPTHSLSHHTVSSTGHYLSLSQTPVLKTGHALQQSRMTHREVLEMPQHGKTPGTDHVSIHREPKTKLERKCGSKSCATYTLPPHPSLSYLSSGIAGS